MDLVKIKTDDVNRFGKSIQTVTGVITFDGNGVAEVDKNDASRLVEAGYTDPYIVDGNFKSLKSNEVSLGEGNDDDEVDLTPELIQTMSKADLSQLAESQGFDDNEWKKLNATQLKDYLTKKFFPVTE